MIPEAAVEAAKSALFPDDPDINTFKSDFWDPVVRTIVEAAAPYIMAEAWEEGKNVRRCDGVPTNPYRSLG